MVDAVGLAVRFPELELGEAGRAASSLREHLLDEVPELSIELRKDDPTTQDFGATLVALISTPAVLMLARGLAEWMRRRGQTIELEIDGAKTTFRATGSVDEVVVKIAEALSRRKS